MVNLENYDKPQKQYVARDLKDGQIGIVTENFENYYGRIVQRFGGKIITLGKGTINSFDDNCALEIRILKNGEKLQISDNE